MKFRHFQMNPSVCSKYSNSLWVWSFFVLSPLHVSPTAFDLVPPSFPALYLSLSLPLFRALVNCWSEWCLPFTVFGHIGRQRANKIFQDNFWHELHCLFCIVWMLYTHCLLDLGVEISSELKNCPLPPDRRTLCFVSSLHPLFERA